ncbi:MAG: YajQ family cyclic di-GMP-binding protein [bacterium]
MADEHSFDVVCKIDLQEVSNALMQVKKELEHRFDFKGSKSSLDLDKDKGIITALSDDDLKLKSVLDILQSKLVKRNVPLRALSYGKIEPASGSAVRQLITLQQGISQDKAKEIVKLIKDLKIKVSAEIQKDQVRVKGKKIDDLQTVLSRLKDRDFGIEIQFVNYR